MQDTIKPEGRSQRKRLMRTSSLDELRQGKELSREESSQEEPLCPSYTPLYSGLWTHQDDGTIPLSGIHHSLGYMNGHYAAKNQEFPSREMETWQFNIYDTARDYETVNYDNCRVSLPRATTTAEVLNPTIDRCGWNTMHASACMNPVDLSRTNGRFSSPFKMDPISVYATGTAPFSSEQRHPFPATKEEQQIDDDTIQGDRLNNKHHLLHRGARRISSGCSSTFADSGSMNNNSTSSFRQSSAQEESTTGVVQCQWIDGGHSTTEQTDGCVSVEWNQLTAGYHPMMGYATRPAPPPQMCTPINDYSPSAAIRQIEERFLMQNNNAAFIKQEQNMHQPHIAFGAFARETNLTEKKKETQAVAQRKGGRRPKRGRKGKDGSGSADSEALGPVLKIRAVSSAEGQQKSTKQELPIRGSATRHESGGRTTFADIVHAHLVRTGPMKLGVGHDPNVTVIIKPEGSILYKGVEHNSVSSFALAVIRERNPDRRSCDGWKDVKYEGQRLEILRERYLVALQQKS